LSRPNRERYVNAFRGTITSWEDFAVFGFLIDRVGRYQLEEFIGCSYAPLERLLPDVINEELGHIDYGHTKTAEFAARGGRDKERIQGVIDAWYPKALDMFGNTGSRRSERYRHWGLKRRTNAQTREEYMREVDPLIRARGLTVPDPTVGREFVWTRAPSTSTWRRWSWRSMPRSTERCPTSRTTRRSWIRRSATARRSWRSSSTATWRVGSREHRRLRQDRPARLGDDPDRSRHEADHQDGRQP